MDVGPPHVDRCREITPAESEAAPTAKAEWLVLLKRNVLVAAIHRSRHSASSSTVRKRSSLSIRRSSKATLSVGVRQPFRRTFRVRPQALGVGRLRVFGGERPRCTSTPVQRRRRRRGRNKGSSDEDRGAGRENRKGLIEMSESFLGRRALLNDYVRLQPNRTLWHPAFERERIVRSFANCQTPTFSGCRFDSVRTFRGGHHITKYP